MFFLFFLLGNTASCASMASSAAISPVTALAAVLVNPLTIVVDNVGNVYFLEKNAYVIRKVDTLGIMTIVAGQYKIQSYTGDGSLAALATLFDPVIYTHVRHQDVVLFRNESDLIVFSSKPYYLIYH